MKNGLGCFEALTCFREALEQAYYSSFRPVLGASGLRVTGCSGLEAQVYLGDLGARDFRRRSLGGHTGSRSSNPEYA